MDFPKEIANSFRISGDFVSSQRWGEGNVNDTFLTTYLIRGTTRRFVHQRINHAVFTNPVGLMENMHRVTTHLSNKANGCRSLQLIEAGSGECFARDDAGNYWRAFEYMENTESPSYARDLHQAYEAARAFGTFQRDLIDLPGPPLLETIPEFHNTRLRLDRFAEVVTEDSCHRASSASEEISAILDRRNLGEAFEYQGAEGGLPKRIVHNDTKLNNVMLDCLSGKAVCVIDLDTVMPGLVASDFGDLVRSAAASATEDERDLSNMFFRLDAFEALARGYLNAASSFLTESEIDSLSLAPMVLTLELAARFLSDYLEGDPYFKIDYVGHNLNRCRTQLKLLASMEEHQKEIKRIIERHALTPT